MPLLRAGEGVGEVGSPYSGLLGVQTGTASLEVSVKLPEKARNRSTV